MKKRLQLTYLLVVVWCLALFGGQSAYASHYQGGQLTYIALGNNQYKVQLAIFRDCSGSTLSNSYTLSYRQTGCAGTGATAPMALVPGSKKVGDPYCANAPDGPSPCAAGKPTNYETAIFETTITLAPAPEWTLSAREGNRPDLGNVLDGFNSYIYYEAKLNNLVNGQVIQNTSPQYEAQNSPIPFVCWRQDTQLSFATTETDGDSLVYSLEEPLDNCGDPMLYASYATNRFIDLTTDPNSPCAAYITSGATGTYSATFPIPSFAISGPACPLIRTATPSFLFDPTLGTMTFNPALFTRGNTTAQQALNKYAVVGKVTEWRRIPKAGGGTVAVKIGSVRREMLVVVIDCGGNQVPGPPTATGGTKTGVQIVNSRDSTFVTAYTCNYTEVRIKFSDPNPTDLLKVSYPELDPPVPSVTKPTYLPQDVASFQLLGNETKTPVAILKIQPDVAFTGRTFRIPVKIEDNGCPIKGITYRTIVLRIQQGNFAKVTPSTSNPFICQNSNTAVTLSASPFRPDSVGTAPAQYGYRWALANGLNPTDTAKQTLQVRPTVTTRYKVKILGLSFRAGTCQDTASVLVRVVPLPVVKAVATKTLVCSGDASVISATATRTDNILAVYSYQWQAANGLASADLAKQNITVRPTVTTRYKLTVSSLNNLGCGDTTSVLVRVAPVLTAGFKADSAATTGRSITEPPLVFTFTNQSRLAGAVPAGVSSQYQWTYQRIRDSKGSIVTDNEVKFSTSATQATLTLAKAGVYAIKLTANVDLGGTAGTCVATVYTLNVRVPDVKVPNIFTPNGDGLNDTFVIQTEQTGSKIQIFNRWGRKIRDYDNYNNDWNGDDQPAGVYYYLITDKNGSTSKGWVELTR
jgi:gliding motility-associated-like protein